MVTAGSVGSLPHVGQGRARASRTDNGYACISGPPLRNAPPQQWGSGDAQHDALWALLCDKVAPVRARGLRRNECPEHPGRSGGGRAGFAPRRHRSLAGARGEAGREGARSRRPLAGEDRRSDAGARALRRDHRHRVRGARPARHHLCGNRHAHFRGLDGDHRHLQFPPDAGACHRKVRHRAAEAAMAAASSRAAKFAAGWRSPSPTPAPTFKPSA